MGMYLATGFVMLAVYYARLRRRILVVVTVIIAGVGVVLITGSRTPIIAIVGTGVVGLLTVRVRLGSVRRKTMLLIAAFVAATGMMVYGFLRSGILDGDALGFLISRAINLDFSNDASASGRVTKSVVGLQNLWDSGILIGPGTFRYGGWFDNGLIRVVHDLGLIGAMFGLVLLLQLALVQLSRSDIYSRVAFLGLICFLIGNLATEFFLVPRASVPLVTAIFLLQKVSDPETMGAAGEKRAVRAMESLSHG
jgi:hypothetical protein